MPPIIPNYDKSLAIMCVELAARWIRWDETTTHTFNKSDLDDMFTTQKVGFLTKLHKSSVLPLTKIQLMADIYELDKIKNSEIR